jgi:hypothetical protein
MLLISFQETRFNFFAHGFTNEEMYLTLCCLVCKFDNVLLNCISDISFFSSKSKLVSSLRCASNQSRRFFLPSSILSISRIRVVEKWPEMVDSRSCIHRLGGSTQLVFL